MRKLLLIPLLFVFMILSCQRNDKTNWEKQPQQINQLSDIDTSMYQVDTVKVVRMKHLTSSNLYNLHCKFCHGSNGDGDGVKARHDSTICPHDLSQVTKPDKEVYYIVLDGKQKMPNQHELTKDDVWVIVIYIKKFRKND